MGLVEDVRLGHGADVGGGLHRRDHPFCFGDHLMELHHVLERLLRDLVGVDLPDLGQGDSGGESADLIMAEGGHRLDLGEGGGLVNVAGHILFNVFNLAVQDLTMLMVVANRFFWLSENL